MITLEGFLSAIEQHLDRKLNIPQNACVTHPQDSALMIVAGPGSGKTTVLVLRSLRHIFVDGISPENIVITTFTRKAASEIRSRLIGWGLSLQDYFIQKAGVEGQTNLTNWLKAIDINQCQTGTLDSFCQKWLSSTRPVGSPNPVILEGFAANFIFRRKIFGPIYQGNKGTLNAYFQNYTFSNQTPQNQKSASEISEILNNRLIQDLVDEVAFSTTDASHLTARQLQHAMLNSYRDHLKSSLLYDFSLCSEEILKSLKNGRLYPNPSIPEIKALLIDEYQDTNPIQEAIYFELAKASNSAVTVVGDDDQALYRFRGATVELFTDFKNRFNTFMGIANTHIEYLSTNHRSTPQIIEFFNQFVSHDSQFSAARVAGKPPIGQHNPDIGVPILGLFRDNMPDLASALSDILDQTFSGNGFTILGSNTVLKAEPEHGALGDALLLSSSVKEYKDDGKARLPALLRESLRDKGHDVFNPRGQDLRDIPKVQVLLGLIVLCLDKSENLENEDMFLTNEAKQYLSTWRTAAHSYIQTNPQPFTAKHSLRSYVSDWANRTPTGGGQWPDEVPLLDLFYKLIVWMPEFQKDPEHLIYLEAVLRCVAQGAHYSAYGLSILNKTPHDTRSRKSVFTDLLAPIAERVVEVDEDLLFAVPRSRLSIMTIHQSKGLEFPLVIVDVGSEFKINHDKQKFRRFPTDASSTVLMESDLAAYTPVGETRAQRSNLDRTFDDLMRLYYVAFSRAQIALLLIGHTNCVSYSTKVKNIATFWARDESWAWRKNPPITRKTPAYPELLPLTLL